MIARLDDELHGRLKARAAAAGRSMNELVIEALVAKLGEGTSRRAVRERTGGTGRLVVPEPPDEAPARDAVIASTRGLGDAVSTALDDERSSTR